MTADRDYFYIATVLHAGDLSRAEFVELMAATVRPVWRELAAAGAIRSARCLARIGDIDMKTDGAPVRTWDHLALVEVDPAHDVDDVERADAAGLPEGIVLAREVLRRPAAAGLAVPRPSPVLAAQPASFTAGVEYIDIPEDHWEDYRTFMREVFGPVGSMLLARGQAYEVIITERVRTILRDPSLPHWNRVHVLVGDFDHEPGFFAAATAAVRDVLGGDADVFEALGAVDHYRRKPCMSKNITLHELSVER